MDNQTTNLASEILSELKKSVKRWFIAFCIMVVLETLTIARFIWYISVSTEVNDVQIENTDGYANYIGHNLLGDLYNGKNTSEKNSEVSETQERLP